MSGLAGAGRVIAHRGASMNAPENTLAAFRLAADQGARAVEFDVSLLGDGTAVLHHDATLDRCTNAHGPLSAIGRDSLCEIDAGSWHGPTFAGEPLPTLDDALVAFDELELASNLELKPHDLPNGRLSASVANVLSAHEDVASRIVVSSFVEEELRAFSELRPSMSLALIVNEAPSDWRKRASAVGASALHINYQYLTASLLAEAASHGFELRVFTVNEPERLAHLRDERLSGVITDHPPLFLQDPAWCAWHQT